jgi:replicative DNA helicase
VTPGSDQQTESALLGSILFDNESYFDLPAGFRVDDFHFVQHREIFSAIADLVDRKVPVDILTLSAELRQRKASVSAEYVAALTDIVPSASSLPHYAKLVMDAALRRSLVHAHSEAIKFAQDEGLPIHEAQVRGEHLLSTIEDRRVVYRTARDSAKKLVEDVDRRFETDDGVHRGLRTGLYKLDAGLFIHPTDFVVIGARPGDGKSVLLWQIARHVARTAPVMMVSLEMNEDELGNRAAMDFGDLHIDDVRKPRNDEAAKKLLEAFGEYSQLDITFVPESDPIVVLREAMRMKRKRGLGLLALDYLQLFKSPLEWGDNRDQRIGELTRRLKAFANEMRVPVLAAAQVKRISHLEKHRDPRPGLEDLRESGNIENDANAVVFIYRPGTIPGTDEHDKLDLRSSDILIAKQRSGPAGFAIPMQAVFEHARFAEPPEDPQQSLFERANRSEAM